MACIIYSLPRVQPGSLDSRGLHFLPLPPTEREKRLGSGGENKKKPNVQAPKLGLLAPSQAEAGGLGVQSQHQAPIPDGSVFLSPAHTATTRPCLKLTSRLNFPMGCSRHKTRTFLLGYLLCPACPCLAQGSAHHRRPITKTTAE